MDRGDIYLVGLDPIAGYEQGGERRVLVISPSDFNRLTNVPIVVPITIGGNFARIKGFTVSLTGTGLVTQGVIRCDQVRALDLRARRGKKMETAPVYIIDEVLARIGPLFE